MAQHAKVAALTDELIHSVLNFDPTANKRAYKHAKDVAKQGLRAHHYPRTTQFDVQATFAGLDEKFRVLNRNHLADALDERVREISKRPAKCIPDCLPAETTYPPPELTWKDILQDDPHRDDEIWKDIDYAADSSEDDLLPTKIEVAKPSPPTTADEDDTYDPQACLVAVDATAVVTLEEAQFWKQEAEPEHGKLDITELHAIRETLFMLAGLPNSLFHADSRVGPEYELRHAMARTTNHLLAELGDIGRAIHRLRQWLKRPSSLPLVQTFEAAVTKRLLEYHRSLALLQSKYLVPEEPTTVSLLELHNNVRALSRPLLRLAQIVEEIEPQLLINPFIHLEILFDQISLAQMALEDDIFRFLSHIFFDCLQTYLKPMRRWMENGELGLNDETFFVFEDDSSSEASSLWHDRFVLRRGQEHKLRSPAFLEPAAQKIFKTGKSVVFLKELGLHTSRLPAIAKEPRLNHEAVCGSLVDLPLSPFSELFQAAFQMWIESKYSLASNVLREYIFTDCALIQTLNSFRIMYLGANGSVFQDFADAIFERMHVSQRAWNDRYLLTELARGIFSAELQTTQSERIIVRSQRKSCKSLFASVKVLSHILLDYALPWPIMNIIQRSSIPIYQQVLSFLLQCYRTKYLLQRISPQSIREIKDSGLRQLSYKLRQRLIWLADVLRSYLTGTVIDPCFADMRAAMSKAEDIDEMSAIHMNFVARLQDHALLSEKLKPIHKAMISLLDLAAVYSQQHASLEGFNPRWTRQRNSEKKKSRRKSILPMKLEEDDSDSSDVGDDESAESDLPIATEQEAVLEGIDQDFGRLLPFVTAGLRSVGRVGAEPVWEMLADRLEGEGRCGQ
ncbi:gamma-tubulin complex component [Paraphaeosphaeria minitans]|uniref:Spindle pole body component n=1 Tax=Paraphaeosphaeria minitans TaxID=565426 RepID=A0A9P6KSV7_9PLEO|nr:gamma-tubulin complex component [Paraphaeosphaeria minitans]